MWNRHDLTRQEKMNQKTKALILITLILLATAGFGVYFFKQKKAQPTLQPQKIEDVQNKQTENMGEPVKSQTVKTISIIGTVAAITKDSIEIKNGETKNTLPLTSDVVVISVNGEKIEKQTIADIKVGDNASIMIDQSNTKVISIQTGKNAGSAI